jgi:hypothetical protein
MLRRRGWPGSKGRTKVCVEAYITSWIILPVLLTLMFRLSFHWDSDENP